MYYLYYALSVIMYLLYFIKINQIKVGDKMSQPAQGVFWEKLINSKKKEGGEEVEEKKHNN